jgi:RimJ/RimL family protein N-acetyltransferase
MLDHAFKSYPDVRFHIAPANIRSQKATAKLGADYVYEAT